MSLSHLKAKHCCTLFNYANTNMASMHLPSSIVFEDVFLFVEKMTTRTMRWRRGTLRSGPNSKRVSGTASALCRALVTVDP